MDLPVEIRAEDGTTLQICAEPSPIDGLERCARQPGHEGEHYFWGQTSWGHAFDIYGVQIYNTGGEAIMNLEVAGESTEADVALMLLMFKLAGERARARGEAQP